MTMVDGSSLFTRAFFQYLRSLRRNFKLSKTPKSVSLMFRSVKGADIIEEQDVEAVDLWKEQKISI